MASTIITAAVVGFICFIAGMTVELFILSSEVRATKAELSRTKEQLLEYQRNASPEPVEVIEIIDPNANVEDPFAPW